MRGKFDEKYAVEVPADILRFPPVSLHEKEILITTEYAQVKIENPLTISAWRVLLGLLRYGKEEKRDPTLGLKVSIETYKLLGFMRNTNWKDLKETLKSLTECRYEIRYKRGVAGFVVAGEFEIEKNGRVSVVLTASFMKFLEDYASLWFYYPFAFFLRKPSAINLHAFLTANSTINRVKIETALERARISRVNPTQAKKYLQMALNELVEVGFLKGYRFEEDTVILERYQTETLRIRAIELQRQLDKEVQEFIEEFRRAFRESKRRRKKRDKDINQKQ
uniref:Initiator Rep protein domain-containing protein n=1 Tax=Thermocrinis ruber TaxID=75906 RepID=A0A7C5T0T9_9AQUI